MKEIQEIIKAYEEAQAENIAASLVTLVHLDGSSYRRPGARMLVKANNQITGAISGGCLEGDAAKKALNALASKKNTLVTYDTSIEDDSEMGIHLGCEGVIQVLFESITENHNPIELLKKTIQKRQKSVLITFFDLSNIENAQFGTCLLMEENGVISGQLPIQELENKIKADAEDFLNKGISGFKLYENNEIQVNVFFEVLNPPVSLVVLGAGNDALPLMRFADILGWDFKIIDRRPSHATKERFDTASQILISNPDVAINHISYDSRTFFVLVTHSYRCDKAMLASLSDKNVPYVGVLGPKKKMNRMLDELALEGIHFDGNTVFGPTGLDIGAETPQEIALSIIAEIQAVLSGKNGGMLKNADAVIHARSYLSFELA